MNIPNRTHRFRFLLLQAAAIGLLAAPSVHAATIDWDGDTSADWSTGGNWAGGTAPANDLTTDIANFNVATYGGNPVYAPNAGTRSINGMTIGASNGTMTLTTTNLGIGGSGISIAEGAGALTINGGLTLGAAQSWTNSSTNALTVSATVNNGGFLLTVGGTGATTISGTISGAGGLTKSQGDTTFTLSGNNTYSGATTVSDGRLAIDTAEALSPNTAVTVSGNETAGGQLFFRPNAANETYNNAMSLSGVGYVEGDNTAVGAIRFQDGVTLGGTLTLSADARVGSIGTRSGTISGQVTGAGGLEFYGVKNGNDQTSTFTLSNTGNDYAGNTTISSKNLNTTDQTGANNTLRLGASGVIPDGVGKGLVAFAGTSGSHTNILDLNGFAETINGLSTTGAAVARITNTASGTAVLTVGAADTTSSFSGVITEAGSGAILALSKTGAGTLTLDADNSYTGGTTISAGTLALSAAGSIAGSSLIDVASGGVFDVSAVTGFSVASGQSLGGAGSILGNLLFGSGSKLVFSTTGTLAMSTGTASFFAGTAGSRFGIDDLVGISSSTPTGTYTLISGTVNTTNLDNLGSANAYNLGSGVSAYFQQGSLQVVVVPEPGAVALVGIGLAGVARAVTRRRRSGAA